MNSKIFEIDDAMKNLERNHNLELVAVSTLFGREHYYYILDKAQHMMSEMFSSFSELIVKFGQGELDWEVVDG